MCLLITISMTKPNAIFELLKQVSVPFGREAVVLVVVVAVVADKHVFAHRFQVDAVVVVNNMCVSQ